MSSQLVVHVYLEEKSAITCRSKIFGTTTVPYDGQDIPEELSWIIQPFLGSNPSLRNHQVTLPVATPDWPGVLAALENRAKEARDKKAREEKEKADNEANYKARREKWLSQWTSASTTQRHSLGIGRREWLPVGERWVHCVTAIEGIGEVPEQFREEIREEIQRRNDLDKNEADATRKVREAEAEIEAKKKATRLIWMAEWINKNGTDEQRDRISIGKAPLGALPQVEAIELLTAYVLPDLPLYQKLGYSDLVVTENEDGDVPESTCDYRHKPVYDVTEVHTFSTSLWNGLHPVLTAIRQIKNPNGENVTWLVRLHTVTCEVGDCTARGTRQGIQVTIDWCGWLLKREYAI